MQKAEFRRARNDQQQLEREHEAQLVELTADHEREIHTYIHKGIKDPAGNYIHKEEPSVRAGLDAPEEASVATSNAAPGAT